jgi:predicted SnoaL-like aldol condensation-catalyzing enzyme
MMKSLAFLLMLGAMSAPPPALAQVPVTAAADQAALLKDKNPEMAANKKLVFDFLRIVLNAGHIEQGDKFVDPGYIEHNPVIPTGRAALMNLFGQMPKKDIELTLPGLVAITADGDLVTVMSVDNENDPGKPGAKYTTSHFDMFRLKNGRIIEHWDDHKKDSPVPKGAPPPG